MSRVDTKNNTADLFTKHLDGLRTRAFAKKLGLRFLDMAGGTNVGTAERSWTKLPTLIRVGQNSVQLAPRWYKRPYAAGGSCSVVLCAETDALVGRSTQIVWVEADAATTSRYRYLIVNLHSDVLPEDDH